MKLLKRVCIVFLLSVISGCMKVPDIPEINSDALSENQRATLASVKRLDAFPFLSMDYYGDADADHLKMIKDSIGIQSNACSSFTAYNEKNEALFSRNHDWPESPVLVLFTHPKSKLSSISLVDLSLLGYTKESGFTSLKERSKLLYSIFLPMDGMNEKGLAIGAMGCLGIGSDNDKPIAFSTEIIRLVLDNAENIDQAVSIFNNHSIYNVIVPLHYLVSDSSGNSAIIEYINGKVQVQELNRDSKALTNFRYYGSADNIAKKSDEYFLTGKVSNDVYGDSYLRYIKIRQRQVASNGILHETEAMKLLESVSMRQKTIYGDFFTVWSVVYNLPEKKATVSIGRSYEKTYAFDLRQNMNRGTSPLSRQR